MIELVARYVGFKVIKTLWRKRFPKLCLAELIEKRNRMNGELKGFMREGRYREAMNHRGRIAGVQMRIAGLHFKNDKRIIKRVCGKVKEQKKEVKS